MRSKSLVKDLVYEEPLVFELNYSLLLILNKNILIN